jgi:hypothetical protein
MTTGEEEPRKVVSTFKAIVSIADFIKSNDIEEDLKKNNPFALGVGAAENSGNQRFKIP